MIQQAKPAPRRSTVLVVDDEEAPRAFLRRMLEHDGFEVHEAADGEVALDAIMASKPDVVLLDVVMPRLGGFEVCRRVREDAQTRLTPIVMITGYDAPVERVQGLSVGADDFLGKPLNVQELLARVRSLSKMKRYTDDLDSAGAILTTMAMMIESRSGYSAGHCHRMANFATAVGRALGAADAELDALYRGGFLHDIGMLAISDAILQKPGPLSAEEYETVKSHPVVGQRLMANLRTLQAICPIIRSHHERIDGSGYPDGLRGDEIPLLAQIVGVVEIYEALTSHRPYQQCFSAGDALTLLGRHADRGWLNRDVVGALRGVIEAFAFASSTAS